MITLKHCFLSLIRFQRRLLSDTTRLIVIGDLPAPAYNPSIVENSQKYYKNNEGMYNREAHGELPAFSMVLPPPNVTGKLHLGHALSATIQDVIARRKRSLGYDVLWVPGTDHAGIATQRVVENHLLATTNETRVELGREKFNEAVWTWADEHSKLICQQLKTMGLTLDWSEHVFTMSNRNIAAVNYAFVALFDRGLIYRKKSLVNWCTSLQSTISDIEIETKKIDKPTYLAVPGYNKKIKFGYIYKFAYKLMGLDEEIEVCTTMPETMLGDTAVAVHPQDLRYKHLANKSLLHPFKRVTIPIIFDERVDIGFGTGALKITPAHSKVDELIAQSHGLPYVQVIGEDGKMINSGTFDGLMKYECRDKIIEALNQLNLFRGMEEHQMFLPMCSRTGDILEYLPKEQWFLNCKDMNARAEAAVKDGDLNIVPEKFKKNWFNWTKDDRDWCISRQLWWGQQIPAYKCMSHNNIVWIAAADETEAKYKASVHLKTLPEYIYIERDTDVLDTWFSAAIYPLVALGWPVTDEKLKHFFPINLMVTGHDILGFWVHRMVMLSLELTDSLPFTEVLLHGVICDSKGAKMSKSKGNVIDPMDIIKGKKLSEMKQNTVKLYKVRSKSNHETAIVDTQDVSVANKDIPECGVDALRFTLLSSDTKSHFTKFDIDECHANKLFCNKIWQSIKYLKNKVSNLKICNEDITLKDLGLFDVWIISRLSEMITTVNDSMDDYDFHLATKAIRNHIYNEFCDVYLEATKPGFANENPKVGFAHAHTLSTVLNASLRCLAPFMVYLTNEVIDKIPNFDRNIIHNFNDSDKPYYDFPDPVEFNEWRNTDVDSRMNNVLNLVSFVRQMKSLYQLTNKDKPRIYLLGQSDVLKHDLVHNKEVVQFLTKCGPLSHESLNVIQIRSCANAVFDQTTTVCLDLDLSERQDLKLEAKKKLQKRIEKIETIVATLEAKCHSELYISNASEWNKLVDREKLNSKRSELKQLQQMLE